MNKEAMKVASGSDKDFLHLNRMYFGKDVASK
jgi:hypothetical protein